MARADRDPLARRRLAIVGLVIVAVVVAVLSALALLRDDGSAKADRAPAATTTVTSSPTATASTTPTAAAVPRADERFIIASTDSLWRSTAGACGGAEPLVERSVDGGASWKDVTPHYRGIAQVASLDAVGKDGAEMVAALGTGCTATGLNSFTAGKYWETDDTSLGQSRYLAFDDAHTVVSPGGDFAAPCADAHGLRAFGKIVAVICDGSPYVRGESDWTKLDATNTVALSIASGDLFVARTGVKGCTGIALARFAGGSGAGTDAGCAADATTTGPIAMATSQTRTYIWSGDTVSRIAR